VIRSLLAAFAVALFTVSGAACTKSGDCEKAVDHIMELIQRDLPKDQQVDVATERADLVKKCKERDGLTKQQEECILAAKDLPSLNSCDRR